MSKNKSENPTWGGYCESAEAPIDLGDIILTIRKDKFLILLMCVLLSLVAYGVSLAFPDKYKAIAILSPAQMDNGGRLGSVASQYSGLAAMAGIAIGKETDKTEQAIALLKSWPFLEFLVDKYDLGPDVYAAKGYKKFGKEVVYDDGVYDSKSGEWQASKFKETGGRPSSWMLYEKFLPMVGIQNDKKTGLVTLSITHVSPDVAKRWLEILIKELNLHFQLRDKDEARRNIDYLEKKIEETSIAEMQNVFFGMVEAQTKALMLSERSEDYLFKIIVRPMLPEEKVSPKRFVISIFGFIFGGVLWCFVVVVKSCSAGKFTGIL